MDTKLVALGSRITKLKDEAVGKDSLLRVDTKLEAVIPLNSLKKNDNGRQRRGIQDDGGIEDIP